MNGVVVVVSIHTSPITVYHCRRGLDGSMGTRYFSDQRYSQGESMDLRLSTNTVRFC
jgi:hypothetical protein